MSSLLIDTHGTAAENTHPDVTPLVFRDAPDIVCHQRTAGIRRTVVLPLTILIAQDTPLIGTEPQAAILRCIAAHDDVAGHAQTLLRELLHRFQRLRVHLDDTTVVTADPVVAFLVFRDGVDITDGHALEVRHRLQTHGDAVLIAGEPHTAQLVEIKMFDGVLRQRGLVALDVQELPPLTALLVEHEHALMVGSHPHEALRVVAHLPDEHVLRHIFIALGPHQFRQRRVPALLILHINIGTHGVRNYPKVLVLVSGHPIVVIGIQGVLHIGILPQHLTLLAIDAHQFAEGRYEHHTLLRLGIGRYTKVLRELIWPVAESEVLEVLSHGVEIVETVLIALHPIVLLRVEVDALHTAEHTPLVQPVRRVSVHLLRHRVVHRIVHTLFQPQPAAVTFLDLVDAVVT